MKALFFKLHGSRGRYRVYLKMVEYRASFWEYSRNFIKWIFLKARWYLYYGNFEGKE